MSIHDPILVLKKKKKNHDPTMRLLYSSLPFALWFKHLAHCVFFFCFFSFNNIILSVFTLFLLILCCLCVFRVVWSSYLHVSFEMLFVISLLVCLYHLIRTVFCLLGSIILLILSLCRPTIPVLVESKSTQTWQVARFR